jgi:hypothetical protein
MKCYKCNCGIETGKTFYPVDPKGTENRRWVCEDCITVGQYDEIDQSVKDIVNVIEGDR